MIGSWFYDVYNRITSFWWPGASTKTYSYDRYGNHTGLGFGVSSTTNRITSSGYTYDAAGNLTARPGNTFQWDGEGRLKSVNNGAVATNSYDGDGKRSVKTSSMETRLYFYDIFGNPFLESAPTQGSWLNGYVYFNGRHVWQNTTNGHFWRHADHLGTPRLRTTGTGGPLCGTYLEPFGGELSTCTTQPPSLDNYKFTGKERDVETGLDNFGARMYGFPQARFLSVDPARESFDPQNPQTWNRYTYVLNNPLKFVDPDGRIAFGAIKLGVKLLLKGGDIAATTAGIVEDTRTLADPNASAGDKAFAAFSLATEIFSPISVRDAKAGGRALDSLGLDSRLLPDNANVVRGGRNRPEDIVRGTGTHPSGVTGVSVESAPGLSVRDLSTNIPHGQVGTTTVGAVRSAGGDVIPTSGRSPNHATMTGLSPEKASELLRPTIPNPAKLQEKN